MRGFNRIILMGNLSKDPELRYTPTGTPVANFSMAVNRTYLHGDEKKEEVTYVDVVAFGKTAEHCTTYLSKGDGVHIEGRLQQRRWETDDGQKRSKHEVVLENVTFLPKRDQQSGHEGHDEV